MGGGVREEGGGGDEMGKGLGKRKVRVGERRGEGEEGKEE